jgi:tetratricopeptide (TPR) repeat protein
MNTVSSVLVQLTKLVLDFIGNNIGWLILLVFLVISKKAISNLLERITKVNFKAGDVSGGVEAAIPKTENQHLLGETMAPEVPSQQSPSAETLEVEKAERGKDWFVEMIDAFDRGDVQQAKLIFETHQREEDDPEARFQHEAFFLHSLYIDGKDDSALRRLEELFQRSVNDEQLENAAIWLSFSYTAAKDYAKAETLWRNAIAKVGGEVGKTRFLIRLASIYKDIGDFQKGIDLIMQRLREVSDSDQKAQLYSGLVNLEKEFGDKETAALAFEKALEFDAANREKLFDAAHLQGEAGLDLLAIANYQTLISLDHKHDAAYNNLAVSVGEFELNGKQIGLYRRAIAEGSTLAMANLANLQISAGLWEEARALLDNARKADNPHENVGKALYRLKSSEDEEEAKWKSLNKRAVEFKRKVRKYGECYFESGCAGQDFEGTWFTEKGNQVLVERNVAKLVASWSEDTLGGLISGHVACKMNISGSVTNCSARISYQRTCDKPRTLLSMSEDKQIECYSYLDGGKKVWPIFSKDPKNEFELVLKRDKER